MRRITVFIFILYSVLVACDESADQQTSTIPMDDMSTDSNQADLSMSTDPLDMEMNQNLPPNPAQPYPATRTCKAQDYTENISRLSSFNLTNEHWCGDFENRFELVDEGNDFIYDYMLQGYWSKADQSNLQWPNIGEYCSSLGLGYEVPTILDLISLVSETSDMDEGFINPLFSDTDSMPFWSSDETEEDRAWRLSFGDGGVFDYRRSYGGYVRCFRVALR